MHVSVYEFGHQACGHQFAVWAFRPAGTSSVFGSQLYLWGSLGNIASEGSDIPRALKHFKFDHVHVMVLIIFAFSISESSVAIIALRTDYNTLRCRSDKGQLSVAIQCAAVSSKQGATFRCHSMRCKAIQTRGSFPSPFNTPWRHSNKGQLSVAMQCPSDKGQFSIAMDPRLCISRKRHSTCQKGTVFARKGHNKGQKALSPSKQRGIKLSAKHELEWIEMLHSLIRCIDRCLANAPKYECASTLSSRSSLLQAKMVIRSALPEYHSLPEASWLCSQ
ncbi:hypothetical protein TEA_009087 [Camellia sinensis var. sinensis]|uniref:Uncharacterized protein n=1 Tax=Camellia sinensis var. sinensis TaxID=542762 RepID=A0A4S4DLA1_CAMSN|nr:hypothetical protein TEA_009087 [Camellia sinensis var. sinensis]